MREAVFVQFTISSAFGSRFDLTEILSVMETEIFMLLICYCLLCHEVIIYKLSGMDQRAARGI